MTDVLTLIQPNTETFKHFSEWIFKRLGNSTEQFYAFEKYSNEFKLPYLIEYLELWHVPILEALSYYNCCSSNMARSYVELCVYMVGEEFKRIELKQDQNYVPY